MKNISNNSIKNVTLGLAILAILGVAPSFASAYNSGYVTPYGSSGYGGGNIVDSSKSFNAGGVDSYSQPQAAPAPVVTHTVTRTVYVNNTSSNQNTSSTSNTSDNSNTNDNSNASTNNNDSSSNADNNLGAAVIFGSGGFLPSGIIGWILFAILILIIVILVRKVTGGAKRYHEEPLKHA